MAIQINPATAEIAIGASQDFVFSGKTGAEYFVDVIEGADKCTVVKQNATTWRVTRTAVGNISLRGSESPFGAGYGRAIGHDDGKTELLADGTMKFTNISSAYQIYVAAARLTAVGDWVEIKGKNIWNPSTGSNFFLYAMSVWGGAGSVDANDPAKTYRLQKTGTDKCKFYIDGVQQGAELTFGGTECWAALFVGVGNSGSNSIIPRLEYKQDGSVSNYSQAIATIGMPPQPISIAFDVPASVNAGDALVPDNQTTNATGYEWRVNNILRSTLFEPDLSQWLVIGVNQIKLTATNPAYTEHLSKNVNLLAPGTVEFTAPDIEKGKPFVITNQSTNTNDFSLDHGDGTVSSNPDLPHSYAEIGAKTIVLTAIYANNITISKSKEIYVFPSGYAWIMEELRTKTQSNIFPLLTEAEIKGALKNAVETDGFGNVLSFWENRKELVNKLTAELWMIKAAKASAMIETANTQEGLRNSNQQIYEHCLEMAEVYGSKEMGTVLIVDG